MMTQDMRDKVLRRLAKVLVGWTITAVDHNTASEGMITLTLKKDGTKRKVRLWATDLGWWFKADKKGRRGHGRVDQSRSPLP